MSLILNNIFIQNGLKDSFIIAAADRRIIRGKLFDSNRRKIFEIPYLKSTVSYFGLAEIHESNKQKYISDWLPDFIIKQANISKTIKEFSFNLHETLNQVQNSILLSQYASGFHISGYNNGYPDFWYFSNIGSMNQFSYKDINNSYFKPTSHFLERDIKDKNWNEIINVDYLYRNGDIRLHYYINDYFDSFMKSIFLLPDVKQPQTHKDYAKFIKFKFEFIAYICKKWFKTINISTPIDIYLLTNNSIAKY